MRSKSNIGWLIAGVIVLVVLLVIWTRRFFCDGPGQFLCDALQRASSGG